ncbi:DUF2071 domain-containing protein [Streptomyces sp. NPDC058307]|uniref:DUF2071 domain-containing protein n=1 Tax=Streptomyces sp. NPDC058307 TaxID=3346439 RepID=UPI0036EABA12
MDASRQIPVVTGRVGLRLPYRWSRMSVRTAGDTVTHTSSRRRPGPRGARSLSTVRTGERVKELTGPEHFRTARWGMHNAFFGGPERPAHLPDDHPRRPLYRAERPGPSRPSGPPRGIPTP